MPNLPSGTVTFVFSDIEGSTTLLKQLGDEGYAEMLTAHRRLMREAFDAHQGQEIDTQGDAFFYSFPRARSAVAAAIAVQRAHEAHAWPQGATVRVRLGLHTGEPAVGDEGYTGLDVVRAARIAAVARGGQILLSDATRALAGDDLPEDVQLRSLGEQRLKDIDRPEPLHELRIPGVTLSPEVKMSIPPASDPGHGPGDLEIPPVPTSPKDIASWARDLKARTASFGDFTRRAIEQRVLAELGETLPGPTGDDTPRLRHSEASPRPPPITAQPPPVPPKETRSVAAEIAQLQSLRDAGALTDEQYRKAVDRAIEGRD